MTAARKTTPPPTTDTYQALQTAYDHFNKHLFAGQLPPCLITLQRQRGAYGYFSGDRFHARTGKRKTDEIAMNPQHIGRRPVKTTLSTLAHEMAHLWQHHKGTPGRRGYHNTEWAAQMRAIGLTPTSTGMAGGKQTGEKMTHIIDKGGPFDRACDDLLKSGLTLTWHDPHDDAATAKKRNTRAKYTCPDCGLNAWAKPAITLLCGECEDQPTMEEEPQADDA